jgi:hypothetical protein
LRDQTKRRKQMGKKGLLIYLTCVVLCIGLSTSVLAQAGKKAVAINLGDGAKGINKVYQDEKIDFDEYDIGTIEKMWGNLDSYWLIWVGWLGSGGATNISGSFAKHQKEIGAWIEAGGAFAADTAYSPDYPELFQSLPDSPDSDGLLQDQESAIIVAKSHPIVNKPNDITDDKFYASWGWSAGGKFIKTAGYDIIATSADGKPIWIVHKKLRISLTTLACTWGSFHPNHIKMPQNIIEYFR